MKHEQLFNELVKQNVREYHIPDILYQYKRLCNCGITFEQIRQLESMNINDLKDLLIDLQDHYKREYQRKLKDQKTKRNEDIKNNQRLVLTLKPGDYIWLKGCKDRHGIRRFIKLHKNIFKGTGEELYNTIECEKIDIRFQNPKIHHLEPKVIRFAFQMPSTHPKEIKDFYPRTITYHGIEKFGGFLNPNLS